ncbi:MAG: putative endonuclease [Collimonas fungivorans]|uniref:YraN family protein n=1 Tax=Collimonas fungivorans TaxID=158899 RepID=UPI0026EA4D22|nr:YraN family protein [Collimonas fungivorans]MDB5768696.1 putative endonuclease [Collimonas fungivorans]
MKLLGTRSPRQVGGQLAEDRALIYLQQCGLQLVERNFRCKGGEIDLILHEPASGLLVFVEVRQRSNRRYGGAAASVTRSKQAKLIIAAQVFLQRYAQPPACRFDVVAIEGDAVEWIRQAFET